MGLKTSHHCLHYRHLRLLKIEIWHLSKNADKPEPRCHYPGDNPAATLAAETIKKELQFSCKTVMLISLSVVLIQYH